MVRYYDIIREAMVELGHKETDVEPDLHFYNHISIWPREQNKIIVKPTAPTNQHFALDTWGYANDSKMAYVEPEWMDPFSYSENLSKDREYIKELIERRANKWDESILLKWRKPKVSIPDDHTLVIGQQPHDETVNGFGFGDHWKKLSQIVAGLKDGPIVVKLHPALDRDIQMRAKEIEKWKERDIHVITDYISIHDVLPRTRVAILENSTAGIECMMHGVPIISYGYPEYHWVTLKAQTIPMINSAVRDLSWHSKKDTEMFIHWYINRYLCKDVESVKRRIQDILWMS